MDTERLVDYDWWLWLTYLSIFILILIGLCKLVLEFPGLLDWKFIKQRLEDVEDPVADIKQRGISLYRPVLRISREVARKISNKTKVSERVRKKGICVMVDLHHPVHFLGENTYPYAQTLSYGDIS
eukprot:TRINITY_DN8870_c0_g1_i1.p1 TRINITY_DN8870_c0_g1~~TRINITY_DN8870_c0_g1_i1.p1  ORF type:complete len:126 (+),score=37.80 TRINITY_DN8870_c0_g1_i1:78-455(+)